MLCTPFTVVDVPRLRVTFPTTPVAPIPDTSTSPDCPSITVVPLSTCPVLVIPVTFIDTPVPVSTVTG